ncbi:hypothetical protein IGI04_014456 [Brassica rapa subsp. trilocularis]|uniref:TF-B3 domain-containing protein n=1 Tax=Brassica rapa subsp. trilocularis TaxID=1813537 RepID=A0ABQ7MM98_BRACM|nr:hypothetical protein IGI04_014456 [Brassica rapa subsp. trilocularis]
MVLSRENLTQEITAVWHSRLIPISYYDELPRHLPKTAILQGTGWPKFVKDYALVDGDFMTFVYNGDNIFKVSIYGLDGCKQARAVAEVKDDDEEEEDKDTSAESEKANTVQISNDKEDSVYSLSKGKDTDTGSSSELANTILRSKNKGKSKGEVIKEESDGKEDSDHSLNNEDKERDTGSRGSQGKSKVMKDVVKIGDTSCAVERVKKDNKL